MSVSIMSSVFAGNFPDVEIQLGNDTHTVKASTLKFVLLALADHANDEGKGAYPSLDKLATKTSMSRRTVQRALDALAQLEIIRCVGVSEYGTDNYSIFVTAIGRGIPTGVTLVQNAEGGDSGVLKSVPESRKSVPESPEPSLEPSLKTSTSLTPAELSDLESFVKRFGRFYSEKEKAAWLELIDKHGVAKMLSVADWASSTEADLTNRPALLRSLTTAADNWKGKTPRKGKADTSSPEARRERARRIEQEYGASA